MQLFSLWLVCACSFVSVVLGVTTFVVLLLSVTCRVLVCVLVIALFDLQLDNNNNPINMMLILFILFLIN